MTTATDLKTIFLEKPLKNVCRNMCHTLIFVLNKKKIRPFFDIFLILPSTQNVKVIDLIFFP